MSNNNNNYRCPECGESNTGDAPFCLACGARLFEDDNRQEQSGENEKVGVLDDIAANTDEINGIDDSVEVVDSLDQVVSAQTLSNPYVLWKHDSSGDVPKEDHNTDTPEAVTENAVEEERHEKTPKAKKEPSLSDAEKMPKGAGKSVAALLLVSAILLFAVFAPLARVSTTYGEYNVFDVSFSPADLVSFSVSMVKAYTVNYQLTPEYREYQKLKSAVSGFNTFGTLSDYQTSYLKEYAKESIRIDLMNNGVPYKANEAIVILSSVVLAVMALWAIFTALALSSAYTFSNAKSFNKRLKRLKKTLTVLITATPFYLLLFLRASRFSYGMSVENFGDMGVSLTFYGVVLAILVAVVFVYKSRGCFTYLSKKAATLTDRIEKRRALALVCLALAFLAMLLPFVTVKTAEAYMGGYVSKKNYHITAGDVYEFSYKDYQYIVSQTQEMSEESFTESVQDAANGYAGAIPTGSYAINYVLFRYCSDPDVLYSFSAVFSSMSLLFLSLFIYRVISAMCDKRLIKKQTRTMAFSVICTLTHMILGITMAGICNTNLPVLMARNLLFSVGVGPVLAFVFTVLAIVLLVIKDKKIKACEYDNPDVSYDPYIV